MKQLKLLMESELLTDEVKTQLTEAITQMKEEFESKLQVEYADKLVTEKATLEEGVNKLIEETIEQEMSTLKEDVAKYRTLEVEYAQKLEDFKEEYQSTLKESLDETIESIIKEEVEELKGDLMEAKKSDFGKRMFEAFSSEFEDYGYGGDIKDIKTKLDAKEVELTESANELNTLKREKVMEGLLSNLKDKKRAVMGTLLENVDTDKLEEKYNSSIEFVLDDKDDDSLNENDDNSDEDGERVNLNEGDSVLSAEEESKLRHLIGFNG